MYEIFWKSTYIDYLIAQRDYVSFNDSTATNNEATPFLLVFDLSLSLVLFIWMVSGCFCWVA